MYPISIHANYIQLLYHKIEINILSKNNFMVFSLSVHLPKDDIQGSNDGDNISKHVVLSNMVTQG